MHMTAKMAADMTDSPTQPAAPSILSSCCRDPSRESKGSPPAGVGARARVMLKVDAMGHSGR